ncbi:MAG: hypothetical protein LBN27_11110 [Prevotellaceae bacterium]|jgi:hypothetical protein|nr:hypothetical protein [Prevotellaceae bacterium]
MASKFNLFSLYAEQPIVTLEPPGGNVQYLGFAELGTKTLDDAKFSILRITEDEDTGMTLYQWANGRRDYDLPFSGYADYEYLFLT